MLSIDGSLITSATALERCTAVGSDSCRVPCTCISETAEKPIVRVALCTIESCPVELRQQVKFREFLSTEYGEAQLDFLLEAMKLEKLDAGEQDQAATKVCCFAARLCASS